MMDRTRSNWNISDTIQYEWSFGVIMDTRSWMLDTGNWILDAGYWMLDAG